MQPSVLVSTTRKTLETRSVRRIRRQDDHGFGNVRLQAQRFIPFLNVQTRTLPKSDIFAVGVTWPSTGTKM
jgi:hypothetical protein